MIQKIGMVVGEISGDNLGAALIKSFYQDNHSIKVYGIMGPKLKKLGCVSFYNMQEISIIGLFKPIFYLPKILLIRQFLINYYLKNPPDVFIGIDLPDFNLSISKELRKAGILTVHYVSPTVWAWRRYRIYKIKKSIDMIFVLFPFEKKIYKKFNVPVKFVGHPVANQVFLLKSKLKYQVSLKNNFKYNKNINKVILMLPGSRNSEIIFHTKICLETANICYKNDLNLKFIVVVVSSEHCRYIKDFYVKKKYLFPLFIWINKLNCAMQLSDVVLVSSGTATLETMFYERPMVIIYKLNFFSYWVLRFLIQVKYIGLPNLLANEMIVKEFIQNEINFEEISVELMKLLSVKKYRNQQLLRFKKLSFMLKKNTNQIIKNNIYKLYCEI